MAKPAQYNAVSKSLTRTPRLSHHRLTGGRNRRQVGYGALIAVNVPALQAFNDDPPRGTGSKIINSIKEGLPDARLVIGEKLLDALARRKGG